MLALTKERDDLESQLESLLDRPSHEDLEGTLREKEELEGKIKEIGVKLDNVQSKYDALLDEKIRRTEGAAIGRQINLDKIADLEGQLKISEKSVTQQTTRAETAEKAVEARTAEVADLNGRLTRMGRELKRAYDTVNGYKAAEAKAEKEALKAGKEEAKEESQAVQKLRGQKEALETEVKELKGDVRRLTAQVNLAEFMQTKKVNAAVSAKTDLIDTQQIKMTAMSKQINVQVAMLKKMSDAYNTMLDADGPGKINAQTVTFFRAFEQALKVSDEDALKLFNLDK